VPRAEVEEAALAAVAAVKNAFALALDEAAESIATLTGAEPRLIRPALRAFQHRGLDAFARQLVERGMTAPEVPAP
jgi:hypothetical protein